MNGWTSPREPTAMTTMDSGGTRDGAVGGAGAAASSLLWAASHGGTCANELAAWSNSICKPAAPAETPLSPRTPAARSWRLCSRRRRKAAPTVSTKPCPPSSLTAFLPFGGQSIVTAASRNRLPDSCREGRTLKFRLTEFLGFSSWGGRVWRMPILRLASGAWCALALRGRTMMTCRAFARPGRFQTAPKPGVRVVP